MPLLVLATYRDDERAELPAELPGMNVLKLPRLDSGSIAALSESMLGTVGRTAEIVSLLERETEGNPFFLVEVVRALAEEAGGLSQIGKQTLPRAVFAGGIKAVLQRRLKQVPATAQPLLQLAAVVGRQLDLRVLQKVEPQLNQRSRFCTTLKQRRDSSS